MQSISDPLGANSVTIMMWFMFVHALLNLTVRWLRNLSSISTFFAISAFESELRSISS